MLKTFKLHMINLSNEIFISEAQENQPVSSAPKIPASYNKRFKYTYKTSQNKARSQRKETPKTIDMQLSRADFTVRDPSSASILGNGDGDSNQRHKKHNRQLSLHHQYTNNYIHKDTNHSKNFVRGSKFTSKSKSQNIKNKTERNQKSRHNNEQSLSRQIQGQQMLFQDSFHVRQGSHQITSRSNEHNNSLEVFKRQQQNQNHKNINNSVKNRPVPKNKYTNSIIKSYKIKSIQLADPLDNRSRRFSANNVVPIVPSCYFDLANQDNLKEIYYQDIQKIQLQKMKFQHHRTFSNRHCSKRRPQTSKISTKIQEFQPRPWESQQKQYEMFPKENSQLI